jgi:hypothetical protein
VKIYYIDVRKHKTTVTNRWFIVNQMSGYSGFLVIHHLVYRVSVRVMVFNDTFNNISAISWQ